MKSSASPIRSAICLNSLGPRAAAHEIQRPLVHLPQIGIATAGKGAQQVERGRRLRIGAQHALRIVDARFGREFDAVHIVAEIARQRHVALAFRYRNCAAWRTVPPCGQPSPPASCWRRSAPPPSAGSRGRCRGCCWAWNSAKLSAQSPPCSRNASPAATCARSAFSLRASPANTSGGNPASDFSASARAAASSYLGRCFAVKRSCFQLSGVQLFATSYLIQARPFPCGPYI